MSKGKWHPNIKILSLFSRLSHNFIFILLFIRALYKVVPIMQIQFAAILYED